jgi:hypothetical protein
MHTMVILNVVLAIFIVAAIMSLLVWGIVTDRTMAVLHTRRARSVSRAMAGRSSRTPPRRVLDVSA